MQHAPGKLKHLHTARCSGTCRHANS